MEKEQLFVDRLRDKLAILEINIQKVEKLLVGDFSPIKYQDKEIEVDGEFDFFVSPFGKLLDNQFEQLHAFWVKRLHLELYLHSIRLAVIEKKIQPTKMIYDFSTKILDFFKLNDIKKQSSAFFDSKIKEKHLEIKAEVNPKWNINQYQLTEGDINYMVSMSILSLNSYIEEYLTKIEDEIAELLLKNGKIIETRDFLKRTIGNPVSRIDNMLNVIGLRSKVRKQLGSTFKTCRKKFKIFRVQRNSLAHESEPLQLEGYSEGVLHLTEFYLAKEFEKFDENISKEFREEYQNISKTILSKFFFVARIALDGLYYPGVLDFCFDLFKESEGSAKVRS